MLDKEVLKNDLYLLTKNFYKVIEVNLDEDTYFEVKVDDAERPRIYNGVRTWQMDSLQVEAFIRTIFRDLENSLIYLI